MSIIGQNILAGSSGGAAYDIDYSCRFSSRDPTDTTNAHTPWIQRITTGTGASAGNRKTSTWSCWAKTTGTPISTSATIEPNQTLFSYGNNDQWWSIGLSDYPASNGANRFYMSNRDSGGTQSYKVWTNPYFRDLQAWYHFVFIMDTTQAIDSNRMKLYVNGVRITDMYSAVQSWPSQNLDTDIFRVSGTSCGIKIGAGQPLGRAYGGWQGYMAEIHIIDGQALDASNFGELDETTNQWVPIKYEGTYGNQGAYLEFKDSSDLGVDTGGSAGDFNAANWTTEANDQMIDTPTNNFAVLNSDLPIAGGYGWKIMEGGLYQENNQGGMTNVCTFALPPLDKKWYFEGVLVLGTGTGIGVMINDEFTTGYENTKGYQYKFRGDSGVQKNTLNGGYSTVYSTTFAVGEVVAIMIDGASGDIMFYKNGILVYTATDAITAANSNLIIPGGFASDNQDYKMNFGTDATFSGTKTPSSTYTDANGLGQFFYQPPAGALAVCSKNLGTPGIALPGDHYNTILYDDGAGAKTGVGFQPDLVWLKARGSTYEHEWTDVVRGVTKALSSNSSNIESTDSQGLTAFGADGFTVGTDNNYDDTAGTGMVGWNWKAGGTAVANTDGTLDSTVSANTTAGFSIVKYVGTGVAATVGHGLSQAPELVIVKDRTAGGSWFVGSDFTNPSTTWDYHLLLNGSDTRVNATTWNDNAPDASVFNIGAVNIAANTQEYISYCFHSVEGYSNVGVYNGNGVANGIFVYTGFRPAYIMIRGVSASSRYWTLYDDARNPYNPTDKNLSANATASVVLEPRLDIVSAGFKCRSSASYINATSNTYLYIAFAQSPFKTTNAR